MARARCLRGSTSRRRSAGTSSASSAVFRAARRSNRRPTDDPSNAPRLRGALSSAPMPARRVATIDLGSNTVRYLLIESEGDARWRAVDQDQRVTRLGQGLADAGRLGEAPMARTAATVVEYAERARRLGAAEVRVVATSAVREAVNGREFAAGLGRASGT